MMSDRSAFEEWLEVPSTIEPLTERDWGRRMRGNLRQPFVIFRQQRLFDEQQPERLQRLGKLLGERAMHAAMEVESDVHAERLRRLDALHDLVEQFRCANPAELGGRIHLDRVEALVLARLGGVGDFVRPVAADPGVGADLVPHLAAEHLPRRQPECPALQIPQRLLEAGECRHEDGAAAVEAAAVADLPDVFDAERIGADESVAKGFERAVHGLGPAFEARFAPAERAIVALNPDEQPSRRNVEGLDLADPALSHARLHSPPRAVSSRSRPAASSSPCSLNFLIGTIRHTLEAGSTFRQSAISCL